MDIEESLHYGMPVLHITFRIFQQRGRRTQCIDKYFAHLSGAHIRIDIVDYSGRLSVLLWHIPGRLVTSRCTFTCITHSHRVRPSSARHRHIIIATAATETFSAGTAMMFGQALLFKVHFTCPAELRKSFMI